MRPHLITLAVASLTTACATVTPEGAAARKRVLEEAAACRVQHPVVEWVELDRFGQLIAYYKENRPRSEVEPFFECARARLR